MAIKKLERHQRILIMGLGLFGGGVGAARFWAKLGSRVTVTDKKTAEILAPSIAELEGLNLTYRLGGHDKADFRDCDLVVVNPAVKPDDEYLCAARDAGAKIVTEIGLVFRLATGPVIGVTGSNGKSTTTALIGSMLECHDPGTLVGGNIGGSLLDEMPEHNPASPLVLELSSFQLHYLRDQAPAPRVAAVTNLSPNHLDWHGTVLRYYEDKRNIARFQGADDYLVLNAEDATLREWAPLCPARKIMTALADPGGENACFVRNGKITLRLSGGEQALCDLDLLRLPGAHNRCNAVMAAAAAYAYCRDAVAIRRGLESFAGLPHRLETVAEAGGVKFVNDSIATTPESAICGLDSFDRPIVIIAGGYDKGTPFEEFGAKVAAKAEAAVLIGATAGKMREIILRHKPGFRLEMPEDFPAAVARAHALCPPGGVVLLSPACASYGWFQNFQQRGEIFRRLAQDLASGKNGPAQA